MNTIIIILTGFCIKLDVLKLEQNEWFLSQGDKRYLSILEADMRDLGPGAQLLVLPEYRVPMR